MSNFIDEIVELNEVTVLKLLEEKIANNENPLKIMDEVKGAMKIIGDKFGNKEYFFLFFE